MATRAEEIAQELRYRQRLNNPALGATPGAAWYLSDTLWNAVLTAVDVISEIVGFTGYPRTAQVMAVTSHALKQRILKKDDVTAWLNYKLQTIYQKLEKTPSTDQATKDYLDAQVDLILELLEGDENG